MVYNRDYFNHAIKKYALVIDDFHQLYR